MDLTSHFAALFASLLISTYVVHCLKNFSVFLLSSLSILYFRFCLSTFISYSLCGYFTSFCYSFH